MTKFAAGQPAPEAEGPDYAAGVRAASAEAEPATVWTLAPDEPEAEASL